MLPAKLPRRRRPGSSTRSRTLASRFGIFPNSAPLREQFAPGLRATFAGNYAIYFVHDERELLIVRVLHGARDAAAVAGQGGFAF